MLKGPTFSNNLQAVINVKASCGVCQQSQNHRMAWVQRDLKGHQFQLCHGQGTLPLDQVVQML